MGFIKEFKEFALKGNMIDLAIGVVIGTAFNKVVSSLVGDIFMPLLGALLGSKDFSNLSLTISPPKALLDPIEIKYGLFINTMIDFVIISFAVFVVIKSLNKLKKQKPEEIHKKTCPECLLEIPSKAKKCGYCCSTISSN
jgi:large conductance mechanosensitive channel